MNEHMHHHHEHDHDCECGEDHGGHSHGMSIYEFLGSILAFPMDETLMYNVCDPGFWAGQQDKLDNERTNEAFGKIVSASKVLSELPEDMRKMTLDAEYGQAFLGREAWMPPLESCYGMASGSVRDIAEDFGVSGALLSVIPADHVANELMMLGPLDAGGDFGPEKMLELARFFEDHPISLLRHMIEHAPADEEGSGFYRAIVEFAAAWMQWDIDAFNG